MKWNLNCPSFKQKKNSDTQTHAFMRYSNLKFGWHADFCYFSHTKVENFTVFTWFYLIFCLSEFHWNFWCRVFLNHKKHISGQKSPKITKKYFWPPFCMGSAHCAFVPHWSWTIIKKNRCFFKYGKMLSIFLFLRKKIMRRNIENFPDAKFQNNFLFRSR